MSDQGLLASFVQESREHLDGLEPDLLAMEQGSSDAEVVNRAFRSVHSIKGAAGFFGLETVLRLSHAMESVMSVVRDGDLKPTRSLVDVLLGARDKLRLMIDDIEHSNGMDVTAEERVLAGFLGGSLPPLRSGKKAAAPAVPVVEAIPAAPNIPPELLVFHLRRETFQKALKHGQNLFVVHLHTLKDLQDRNRTPLDFLQGAAVLGDILDAVVDFSVIDSLDKALETDVPCELLFATVMDAEMCAEALEVPLEQVHEIPGDFVRAFASGGRTHAPFVRAQKVEPPPVAQAAQAVLPAVQAPTPMQAASAEKVRALRQRSEDTVRVPVSLLDDLMNLAGELVLGRNQLLRLSDAVARQVPGLVPVLQSLDHRTSEMQDKVMRTRLQPIGTLFSRFTRLVRDLSREVSKEIELEVSGENVELDKSILEALTDPLTHLVRNCVDHGVELPEDRERLGKPRYGRVRLTAGHVGGQVVIEVSDDGRGMDPARLKTRALEKGLIHNEEAGRLTERQALALIFLPGFSTASSVTALSGRGVGMDVVKTNIEKLGGSVEVLTDAGRGSRFQLRLPLTLAIIPALIIGLGDRRFAVPQVNLEEIVKLGGQHKAEVVRGSSVLRRRGKLLPLVRLSQVLNAKRALPVPAPAAGEGADTPPPEPQEYTLVLKTRSGRFGLVVDSVFDTEEIVVKPLSAYLQAAHCYSGATILGDGTVALILDAGGVAERAGLRFGETEVEETRALQRHEGERQSLLIFENAPGEAFAVSTAMIGRIQKIAPSDIIRVGAKEFLKLGDAPLRLVRLHEHMAVTRPESDGGVLHVLVMRLLRQPVGIVAQRVLDAVETDVALDRHSVSGAGILGSAVLGGRLVVFLDPYGLCELADPETHKWRRPAEPLREKRVLLVDDTDFFRVVEETYLRSIVGEVDVAKNAFEAWDLLNRQRYDALVTDLEMPGMNGFELVRRLRATERHRGLPVIALTMLTAERYQRLAEEAGVDAYEFKLDKEHLRETLTRLLTRTAQGAVVRAQSRLT